MALLGNLSTEIFLHILLFLPPTDIAICTGVNRTWRGTIQELVNTYSTRFLPDLSRCHVFPKLNRGWSAYAQWVQKEYRFSNSVPRYLLLPEHQTEFTGLKILPSNVLRSEDHLIFLANPFRVFSTRDDDYTTIQIWQVPGISGSTLSNEGPKLVWRPLVREIPFRINQVPSFMAFDDTCVIIDGISEETGEDCLFCLDFHSRSVRWSLPVVSFRGSLQQLNGRCPKPLISDRRRLVNGKICFVNEPLGYEVVGAKVPGKTKREDSFIYTILDSKTGEYKTSELVPDGLHQIRGIERFREQTDIDPSNNCEWFCRFYFDSEKKAAGVELRSTSTMKVLTRLLLPGFGPYLSAKKRERLLSIAAYPPDSFVALERSSANSRIAVTSDILTAEVGVRSPIPVGSLVHKKWIVDVFRSSDGSFTLKLNRIQSFDHGFFGLTRKCIAAGRAPSLYHEMETEMHISANLRLSSSSISTAFSIESRWLRFLPDEHDVRCTPESCSEHYLLDRSTACAALGDNVQRYRAYGADIAFLCRYFMGKRDRETPRIINHGGNPIPEVGEFLGDGDLRGAIGNKVMLFRTGEYDLGFEEGFIIF